MSHIQNCIKKRIEKLEFMLNPPNVWLRIITDAGDREDDIEQLKAEAIEAWKQENPDQEPPQTFNWIIHHIVGPKPAMGG
jgi:hypothetical protein